MVLHDVILRQNIKVRSIPQIVREFKRVGLESVPENISCFQFIFEDILVLALGFIPFAFLQASQRLKTAIPTEHYLTRWYINVVTSSVPLNPWYARRIEARSPVNKRDEVSCSSSIYRAGRS